jgi:tetratricopeptide (TPR) repeat protein
MVPLLVMAACSAAVTIRAQRDAMAKLDVVDFAPRMTNAIISYGQYILKMLWPTDLSVFYPYYNEAYYLKAAVVFLIFAVVTVFAVYHGRSSRYLSVGWLWYIVTLVPVIGIVRVGSQSHADRYTYVPLMGLFVIIVWGTAHILAGRPQLKVLFAMLAVIVLASAGVVTNQASRNWKDTYALSLQGAKVTKSPKMLMLLASSQIDRNELDAALANVREVEKIEPGDAEVLNVLGRIMLKMDKFADAAKYCQRALEIEPNRREIRLNAGLALYGLGQVKEGEAHLRKAIELDPYWAVAYSQLGRLLGETGRQDEGIAVYKTAIKLNPILPECHYNLGLLYMHRNDFENASTELKKEIAIDPDADTWNSLGGCMVAMKKMDEAEKAYRESIRLKPDYARAHYNLGVVLEETGRRNEAVMEVEKATLLEPWDEDAKAMLARIKEGKH